MEQLVSQIESKNREKLIKSELKMYKFFFQHSSDAFILLKTYPEIKFFRGNFPAVKMFGCETGEEFASKTLLDLSPKYQPNGTPSSEKAKGILKIVEAKGVYSFEWRHKTINGTEFLVTVLLTITELKGEKVLQAIVRDISEKKRMEKALKNIHSNIHYLSLIHI